MISTRSIKTAAILVLAFLALAGQALAQLDTSKWYALDNVKDNQDLCRFTSSVSVSGGVLTMNLQDSGAPYSCGTSTGVSYSGPMIVSKAFSFTYGTVKARIQFGEPGNTLRSAIWLWGGDSSSSGYPATCIAAIEAAPGTDNHPMSLCTTDATPSWEIDIAECESQSNAIYNNWLEWESGSIVAHAYDTASVETNVNDTWHTVALHWFSDRLVYQIDDVTANTQTVSIDVPMFLIIDQEISNLPTSFPNTTKVDWVNICSDPNAVCNPGDPTTAFSEGFNQGVSSPAPVATQIQGEALQGVTTQ